MSEWWTYSLSDFLMFSPRTYFRLIELYNLAIWPVQIAALAAGAVILILLYRGSTGGLRAGTALLAIAIAWAWVAFAFLLARYDAINWAGRYFAAGFLVQALLFAVLAIAGAGSRARPSGDIAGRIGIALYLFALCGYPLVALAAGRSWAHAEVFGLAPDPTAIGTLGLALAIGGRMAWLLSVVPALWCVVSGALLWAVQAPEAPLPPAAALLVLSAAVCRRLPQWTGKA